MLLDLDVRDRQVVIVGTHTAAARAACRFARSGAQVQVVDSADLDATRLPQLLATAGLVVTTGTSGELTEQVREVCTQLGILCTQLPSVGAAPGRVLLVGGGPGTTQLLTLEACQALLDADVVLYDRLAPTADLVRLAPGAELVDVGKLPYHHPTTQARIEELIIERARRGEVVVRLKGGDPFVFGRGGEELRACRAAGVEVRVVPGVTSAVAVPAAAGIPVTSRGTSHAFTVLSGHQLPTAAELESLARLGGTLVILMGMANLTRIVTGLVSAGLAGDTPAAVVERGFTDSQRTTTGRLHDLPALVGQVGVTSPAVVVIGDVAAFATEQTAVDLVATGVPLLVEPGR